MKELLFYVGIFFSSLVAYSQTDSVLTKPVLPIDNKIDSVINKKTPDTIINKPSAQPIASKAIAKPTYPNKKT